MFNAYLGVQSQSEALAGIQSPSALRMDIEYIFVVIIYNIALVWRQGHLGQYFENIIVF